MLPKRETQNRQQQKEYVRINDYLVNRLFRRLFRLLESTTSRLPRRVQLLEAEGPGG